MKLMQSSRFTSLRCWFCADLPAGYVHCRSNWTAAARGGAISVLFLYGDIAIRDRTDNDAND
jgi:hypothetical protein